MMKQIIILVIMLTKSGLFLAMEETSLLIAEKDTSERRDYFFQAAFTGDEEIIEEFLTIYPNPDTLKSARSSTMLIQASYSDHGVIVQKLIEHNADINYQRPTDKMTALMFAVLSGGTRALKVLLDNGANKELTDINSDTALSWAVLGSYICEPQPVAVKMLLDYGAEPYYKHNFLDKTPSRYIRALLEHAQKKRNSDK